MVRGRRDLDDRKLRDRPGLYAPEKCPRYQPIPGDSQGYCQSCGASCATHRGYASYDASGRVKEGGDAPPPRKAFRKLGSALEASGPQHAARRAHRAQRVAGPDAVEAARLAKVEAKRAAAWKCVGDHCASTHGEPQSEEVGTKRPVIPYRWILLSRQNAERQRRVDFMRRLEPLLRDALPVHRCCLGRVHSGSPYPAGPGTGHYATGTCTGNEKTTDECTLDCAQGACRP